MAEREASDSTGEGQGEELPLPTMKDLRERLRTTGLRSTTPRLAVLEFLQHATAPLSHAEIAEGLEPRGFDRTTVYRNLIALTEAGLVSRSDLGDHVWRFEISRGSTHTMSDHPHFVCSTCGEVVCLHDASVTIANTPGSTSPMLPQINEVLLKGICERCK